MTKKKMPAFSLTLVILLLAAMIILVIMAVRGGTLDQFQKNKEIEENVKVDLQQVQDTADSQNQDLKDILAE